MRSYGVRRSFRISDKYDEILTLSNLIIVKRGEEGLAPGSTVVSLGLAGPMAPKHRTGERRFYRPAPSRKQPEAPLMAPEILR